MNLVEELTPYTTALTNYIKRDIAPNNQETTALIEIYNRWARTEPKSNAPHTATTSCSGCVTDALKMLYNWNNIYSRNVTVPFKGVLSTEDKVKHLQAQCDEKGIEYRWNAGVKKLSELLNG